MSWPGLQSDSSSASKNFGYEASLERRKVYIALPDARAEKVGRIRIIDESGEDYL